MSEYRCQRGHLIAGANAQRQGSRVRCRTCSRVNARRSKARKEGRPEPKHGEPPAYSTNPLPGVNAPVGPNLPPAGVSEDEAPSDAPAAVWRSPDTLLADARYAFTTDVSYVIEMIARARKIERARLQRRGDDTEVRGRPPKPTRVMGMSTPARSRSRTAQ